MPDSWFPIILTSMWSLVIAGGMAALWSYQHTPGQDGQTPPATWPSNPHSKQPSSSGKAIMFVHPHCSCSRASIHNLSHIIRHYPDTEYEIVFWAPDNTADEWAKGPLWHLASQTARVSACSVNSEIHGIFNATTSGFTVYYDRHGHLKFYGGITPSRGHQGESAGSHYLRSALNGDQSTTSSVVYGCPLTGQQSLDRDQILQLESAPKITVQQSCDRCIQGRKP